MKILYIQLQRKINAVRVIDMVPATTNAVKSIPESK